MKLSTVVERIPHWYASGMSIHLTSSPGVGKTSVVSQAPSMIEKRTHKRMGLVIINGGMLTPLDVLGYGIPKHHEHRSEMVFTDPFFFRTEEGKRLEEYDGGIVFVDEADKADVDVKKVLGEGALSGRFGPHRLPKGWVVWSAGNRAGDRSGSTKELDHLINRRLQVEITPDVESWTDWAITSGVMPPTVAFAVQNPNIVFESEVPKQQGPWCTPRSLVKTDSYLQILAGNGLVPHDSVTVEEVGGMIGAGAAAQLFAFFRLEREMPKYEDIIKSPETTRLPDKPDAQMLVSYSLAHRVVKDTAESVLTYISRMPKEFAVTFASAACKRDHMLAFTPAFQKWVKGNASLMAAIAK